MRHDARSLPLAPVTEQPRPTQFTFDAKLAFHVALAAVPLVVVFVPVVWMLAIAVSFFADRAHPGHKRYSRAIWALALVDLAIALGLVLAVTGPGALFGEGTTNVGRMVNAPTDPPRLGVVLDQSHDGAGARIESVVGGSPAERGGLRDGDVITSVDRAPIANVDELQRLIRETPVGSSRSVTFDRDGRTQSVRIEPETSFEPPARALFEVDRQSRCLDWLDLETIGWSAIPLLLVIPLAIFVAVRSREPDRFGLRIWPVLLTVLALSLLGAPAMVAWGLCTIRGGSADGDVLLALHAQVAVMAMLGLGWKVWVERRSRLVFADQNTLRRGRVYTLGLVYILATVSRISAIVFIANALGSEGNVPTGSEPIEEIVGGSASSVLGVVLVIAAIAVVGPIAEEIVFRGVLLPWLGRHLSPTLAIVTSSALFGALHPHYGPRVVAIFAIGAVLGWARWRTGDLRTSIALHITVNGAFSLGLLAQ